MTQVAGRPAFSPIKQPYYAYQNGKWQEASFCPQIPAPPSPIKILTWNIDFQKPNGNQRMTGALQHLQTQLATLPKYTAFAKGQPSVIFLQEMVPEDLAIIQSTPWVQSSFFITDVDSSNWLSFYGTTTLISRNLPIVQVFRTRYTSDMGRDGLYVDIRDKSTVVRLCNTHLESLVAHPRLRPGQVEVASQYLRAQHMDAGVMAGDFNAIEGFDRTLHTEYGLKDAYLENGGVEGQEEGFTWGMQSGESGRRYGFSRLDKVLFCGKVQIRNLRRFGAGMRIDIGEEEEVEGLGEGEGSGTGQFITNHLKLMADLYLEKGSQF